MTNILEVVQGEVYGVWYLVGAALVFFMQLMFTAATVCGARWQ